MKKIKEHVRQFNYKVTENQEEDIRILYNLNYLEYSESTLILCIEKFMRDLEEAQDNSWRKNRRPTIFSTKIDVASFDVPKFPKSEETFDFLISKLGNNLIPFALVSEEQKKKLVESMYPIVVEPGVELIVENTMGAEMYVVEEGEFGVYVQGKEQNKLYKGEVFGELALLHGIPRTATVLALQKSKVWSCEQTSFSCIRIRDQMYRRTLAKEAIEVNKDLMALAKTPENIERILDSIKTGFIRAGKSSEQSDDEIIIAVKNAKIRDSDVRDIKPKDVLTKRFVAITDLDCVVLNLKSIIHK